jgi:hypothetical protein
VGTESDVELFIRRFYWHNTEQESVERKGLADRADLLFEGLDRTIVNLSFVR